MARPADRRVQRTHKTLRDALVRLVIERGWDELSVKDICDAADVGRSTFYEHFAGKEDLLTSGFSDLGVHLRAPRSHPAGTVLRFVHPLFEHALGSRPLFRALVGKTSGHVVERRFRSLVLSLVAEELGRAEDDPLVRFLTGGVVELLVSALELRDTRVDELDATAQRLAAHLLEAPPDIR